MWHALRAELAYSRPFLFGSLGIAAGVATLVSVVLLAVGDGPPRHVTAGLRGVFLILAPMVVGFIAQAYRYEERRVRLLLAGPLTPRQLIGVTMLLSVVLFGVGVLAATLLVGAEALITGKLELESLRMVGYVGGLLFMQMQMGLLAQEATAARGQGRLRAAAAGWAAFVLAVLLLAALSLAAVQEALTWIHLTLGSLIVALSAMLASAALHAGRTDFTR